MGPCAASVQSDGVLIAAISGGGETLSVIPISNATNLNGVGAGMVGWTLIATDAVEGASTTTVLNLTSHVARVGDAIFSQTGTAANQRAWSIVSAVTTNTVTLANALPATPTALDQVLIMRPVLIAASGAPSGQSGTAIMANIDANYQNATSTGILKLEDVAVSADGAGVNPLFQIESAITQAVSGTNDNGLPKADLGGRVITTTAPAAETWWSCTGEITTATNTQLKASVASNRHYITSFGCAATGTNPNQIYLTDGSGGAAMDLVTTTSNAVAPSVQNTYPIPLRGSSATAVFVTTITTGAVRCCAAGYISTI